VERCDVLVVGGGPGGSSVAWGLRGSGLDVVVFDRKTFPRDKVCAGWITPQICAELSLEPEDYAKERLIQAIRGFAVSRQGDRAARVEYDRVVSYGIRRCEFDQHLLARSGARLRLGAPLRDLRREGGRWVLDGELSARWLVGAGGHFCPVARRLGARPGEGEPATVLAREIEFEMTPAQQARCGVRADLPELFFARDLRGYGWVVRKGDWLNVGLGRQDASGFARHLDVFLDGLIAAGKVPPDLPRGLRGHAYLLYDQAPRSLGAEGVLLVGDAAGLAYGRSGEGIRPAVESGLLAARALRAASAGDGEPERAYPRALTARFGPRHGRMRKGPSDWLPRRWRGPVAGRLLGSPWFARRVVVDRWFLRRQIPLLLAALLLTASAAAQTLAVGSAFPALGLEDQHGTRHAIDASVRAVLFSRDMDGGGVIRKALDAPLEKDALAFLARHGAVCVADVSRMPGLIRRAIARPRLRRRPYPLLLDEEGPATAALPSAEGKATLIRLDALRIVAVEHYDSPEALRAALEGGAAGGP